ncbi:MAG: diguanylate cyclase domain-containing protein, partial [Thermoleophilaceae bacterium]
QSSRPQRARVAGLILVLGALLGMTALFLPHPGGENEEALLAISVVSLVLGIGYLAAARHIPGWVLHPTIVSGGLMICGATYWSGRASGIYATMLFWIALYSGFFFSRLAALMHVAFVLACYAVVLSQVGDPTGYSPLTRWLLSAIALSVTALVTSSVMARRRAAEERGQRFFDLSTDMLCTASGSGYFIDVNPAWTETLGYTRAELLARPFVDFVHPDDRARTAAEASRVFEANGTAQFENRYRAKDGGWRWLQWSSKLSHDHGLVYSRATDVTERKQLEAEREQLVRKLDSQAHTDPLTSLPNRRWLRDELEREMDRAERQEFDLCLALIDLDHFKHYNDRHGHQAGDELLREAAESWRSGLRTSDFLARYGGDEFIALLPACDPEEAKDVIERMRAATPAGLTTSAGIATWDHREPAAALIARADAALYGVKASRGDDLAPAK